MSSISRDLPPTGLSPEEASQRFLHLQGGLVGQWKLIQSMNQLEQTMVVVPSISVDVDFPGTILQAYEERLLFLLFLLRKPLARIIYCTSQPISENIIDYYLGLLPGVIPSHARKRLTALALYDSSPRPLTRKILERPRVIEKIRSLITDRKTTHLVPFNTTMLERDLALRLGIPMYGADPAFEDFGSKSGCRHIFMDEGVPHPLGVEDLNNENDLVEAISNLRLQKPGIEQVVAKLNQGVSGEGNAVLTLVGLPLPKDPKEKEAIRERLLGLETSGGSLAYAGFFAALEKQGGIVEERLIGDEFRSPSVQARITPLGKVEILSTHDQLLGGGDGQSFLGCTFPADSEYSVEICSHTARIGAHLCREGVLGRFAIDFVTTRDRGGPWSVSAIEINLRKGGTTAPYLTLEFLTDGHYDPATGRFTTRHGSEKYYVANDHVESAAFCAITPDDLFDFVVRHGLHFDHTTQTGVVFHMLSAITEYGRFGFTAVGNTHEDARELYDRTVATISYESDRALNDPGFPEE